MHDMPRDDRDAEMAKSELYRAAKYAMKLHEMIKAGDELEGWTQSKITKASDYLASVFHYLDYELKFKHGNDNKMDMMPMGGEPQEKMAFSLAERLESAMRRDKHDAIIAEAKKKNDGNLANNAKPYDKVTRGDVIAGRLGKDAMGGKKDKKVKESDTTEGAMKDKDAERDGRLKETSVDEGWDDMVKAVKDKEKEKGTGKFDKKITSTGTQYTKRDLPGQDTADDGDEKARKRKAKKVK